MTRAAELTGRRFGKLVAVRRTATSRNGHARWVCVCDCGNYHESMATHLISNKMTHCGCSSYTGERRSDWGGVGDISGDLWTSIKRGANGSKGRKELQFSITMEFAWHLFLKQNRRCALSGLPLNFTHENGVRVRDTKSASLDRIDSNFGYTEDNVQWVHKDINMMKGRLEESYFLSLCSAVASYSTDVCRVRTKVRQAPVRRYAWLRLFG